MRYRELGNTGLKTSIIGYGASPLGGVFGEVQQDQATRAVHTALELGINYFDVAPYYGATKAETVLGTALKGIQRDSYILATKVGRYGSGNFDYSAARVKSSVDESLSRLQVDYLDIIQCHDIEFSSPDQIVDETLPALREIQKQGKVRFVGITGLLLTNFPVILDRTAVDLILSFCHYCLNDTSLERIIPYLQSKQVGIVNASPFSMGLLTMQGPPSWHPASDAIKQAAAAARAFCEHKGVDLAQVAFQFSLANPDVATTVVGLADAEIVAKNVRWLDTPLDEQLLTEALAILAPVHNETWSNT
ncbi:MAG: aldo/keto reductase [Chloroflexota bacterium]